MAGGSSKMDSFRNAGLAVQASLKDLNRSLRTLSLSGLLETLAPSRYDGMDRWMVKGVQKRWASQLSFMLYDLVRLERPPRSVLRSQLRELVIPRVYLMPMASYGGGGVSILASLGNR